MHYLSETIISASDATSQTSIVVDSNQLISASFQAHFGDATAVGTLQIQGSNDLPSNISAPTTWTNLPNASAAVTAGAAVLIVVPTLSVRWVRAVYTSTTPGSTTIIVNIFAQYP